MKFIKTAALFLLLSSITFFSFGQNYKSAIGIRGGFSNGLTAKTFIGDQVALEGILALRWKGFSFTGLYEMHRPIGEVDRLYWFYGGGAHIGIWHGKDVYWGREDRSYTVLGVDGIIGLGYSFKEVPIDLTLDWKPVVNLTGTGRGWGDAGAFSIRYYFN